MVKIKSLGGRGMNEENNMYENNNQEDSYTQEPEENYVNINGEMFNDGAYNEGFQNYDSGKGQNNGLGIASMILGICSILFVCCLSFASNLFLYTSAVLGIFAIILGIVQIIKNESKGMAIAGIICGAIGVLLFVAVLVLGILVLAMYEELGIDPNASIQEIMEKLESMNSR